MYNSTGRRDLYGQTLQMRSKDRGVRSVTFFSRFFLHNIEMFHYCKHFLSGGERSWSVNLWYLRSRRDDLRCFPLRRYLKNFIGSQAKTSWGPSMHPLTKLCLAC